MRFSVNVSILFTEVPLLERFAAARDAGFAAVELWWPSGEDPAAVEAAIRVFRAYAKKTPLQDGDYTMQHTALVYLMDQDGRFVGSFNLDRPPAEAARELLKYS